MKRRIFNLIAIIALRPWVPNWLGVRIWSLRWLPYFDSCWEDEMREIIYEKC